MKFASLVQLRIDPDPPPMNIQNLAHDRQADPAARIGVRITQLMKNIKYPFMLNRIDTNPVIRYRNLMILIRTYTLNIDMRRCVTGKFQGVVD